MASLGVTPASQHLILQLVQVTHQLGLFPDKLFVLLQAALATMLVHLEGVGPFGADRSGHIVCHVTALQCKTNLNLCINYLHLCKLTYVDMIGRGAQPLEQVVVAELLQLGLFHIYYI
jgi:hypothetical protein